MANVERLSLPVRLPARIPLSPAKQSRVISGTKRARSPAPGDQTSRPAVKRARPTVPAAATPNTQKQKAKADRQARKDEAEAEFRFKYKRHIARSRFYFDMVDIKDESIVRGLTARIKQLGGQIEDFLQSSITHFICFDIDRASKAPEEPFEKENRSHGHARGGNASRRSPSKTTTTRLFEEESTISQARSWEHVKIWDLSQLDRVLHRCLHNTRASECLQPAAASSLEYQLRSDEEVHTPSPVSQGTWFNGERHLLRSAQTTITFLQEAVFSLSRTRAMYSPQSRLWNGKPRTERMPNHRGTRCIATLHREDHSFPSMNVRSGVWEKSQLAEKECQKDQEENRKQKLRQF
ncbi:hypothetical protein MPER_04567 [Moniliophthora perniciosa FA553]|nr:hypothetical protein MPER_04567 [Moniliophthora perniciosa FA553]